MKREKRKERKTATLFSIIKKTKPQFTGTGDTEFFAPPGLKRYCKGGAWTRYGESEKYKYR
jgi:hypothetical protein